MARSSRPHAESEGRPLATAPRDTVVVHGRGVHVGRADLDVPTAEARHRFGGLDPVAVLAGVLTALGTLALLGALSGLVVRSGLDADLTLPGLITGLVLLALALLIGGYVAGRVARYDGARNGLLTGVLFVLVTAGLAAAAAADDRVRDLGLPSWLGLDSARAVLTALVALALVLGAATLGGMLGARWHRRADSVLLGTRPGGVNPYPSDIDRMETS